MMSFGMTFKFTSEKRERDEKLKKISQFFQNFSKLASYGKLKTRTFVKAADITDACNTSPSARYRRQ